MERQANEDVTRILAELDDANEAAIARVLPMVYDELRALSRAFLRSERPDHTLQATALVHEAYLSLARRDQAQWRNRAHFFRAAAKTMRHILVNHAVAHRAAKRGGGRRRVSLDEAATVRAEPDVDLVALDDALNGLRAIDPLKVSVVELRYFAGCSIEETAETLGISTATVERDWRFARAWLRTALEGDADPG